MHWIKVLVVECEAFCFSSVSKWSISSTNKLLFALKTRWPTLNTIKSNKFSKFSKRDKQRATCTTLLRVPLTPTVLFKKILKSRLWYKEGVILRCWKWSHRHVLFRVDSSLLGQPCSNNDFQATIRAAAVWEKKSLDFMQLSYTCTLLSCFQNDTLHGQNFFKTSMEQSGHSVESK